MQYIGDGKVRTRAEAEQRLEGLIERSDSTTCTGLMLLERKSDGRPIGHAGLVAQTVQGQDELEIGYWIAPEFWGQGFATEAAAALRDHGLRALQRRRLISLIQHGNAPSVSVARKIGMSHERDVVFRAKRVMLYSLEQDQHRTA